MEKRYRCSVCGYIHIGSAPPEICPVCGAPSSAFEQLENEAGATAERQGAATATPAPAEAGSAILRTGWKCLNCAWTTESAAPPDACPVCGAVRDDFTRVVPEPPVASRPGRLKAVVLGGGIAGVSAAETLRAELPDADITLISSESRLPVYRLNLTRYLAGEVGREQLPIHPLEWYEQNRITPIMQTAATEVDLEGRRVLLSNGPDITYDALVLATGAHPFVPPFPGAVLENVFTIRDADDADRLLARLAAQGMGTACVCIGGGILGLELAGALAARGADVTVLENTDWLMPRQLTRRAAEVLKRHLAKLGISVRENARTKEIVGDGACCGVRLDDGTFLPAAIVTITAGVRPNTWLARKAGLEVHHGVVADSRMQTSHPGVWTAGDVSEHFGQVYGLWGPAMYQGRIAALNIAGVETHFGGMPRSNVMKVLGLDLFSIGLVQPPDGSYAVHELEEDGRHAMAMIHDGRIAGAVVIGDPVLAAAVRRAMEQELVVPEHGGESGPEAAVALFEFLKRG